ncbi:hypothetical protein TSUD_290440 [Trifolium subterraneum]|uniref:Retrotransposon gag domain-containing protein n=1 Tax=Trifolium subterraneum TaxID=3900 RepID=A0A2Z6MP60_TRISU|nr:hypothetical protein TSUD_290440 [Trifolium subterraneum]
MTNHGYNNNKSGGVMSCHNSPRRLTHIVGPLKNTRQIEIKSGLLQILDDNPFAGLNHEDPYSHLTKFYEIVDTLGASEAEEESVFMRMFLHSLIGKAKDWYLDQPAQVMTNWNTLEEKFLNMFFPHHKFMEAKIAITLFSQGSNETLCEAWDRYLYAVAGGSLMSKSAEDAIVIIEKMALNDHQDEYNRNPSQRKLGVIELGGMFAANTETNPNEHYKSISTRSGKVIGKDIGDNLENERVVVEMNEKQEGEKEERTSMNSPYKIKLPYPPAPTKKIAIEENEELKKVGVVEKDQNEGEEEEKLVEKEVENNQERVKVNKVEIDEVIEYICALFNKKLTRTWTPHHLYFKFMEFLPNKLKTKDDVFSVSFWPP